MRTEIEILNEGLNTLAVAIDNINTHIGWLGQLTPTRNVSIAKTKLDEAVMWLEREQAELTVKLANRTCR